MMGIDPGRRSPGSIYNKLVRSREDWKQQVAIPSTAGVRTLLLLNSRARSFSPAPSSSSTGRKLAAEKESNTQTKETMSVSYKVKKIGKARTPLAVDGYIALMACNGNFPHFYSESKKGHWSIKQHASKSQRITSPPPTYREWPINMATGSAGNEAKWRIDQEHDLLGLGGRFNIQVKAQ